MEACSRRAFLSAAPVVTIGCLERSLSTEQAPTTSMPAVDGLQQSIDVTLAHWFGQAVTPSVRQAVQQEITAPVEVSVRGYSTRRELERTVASAIVDATPPGTFQSVMGAELGRYITAVTVHAIPDLVPTDVIDELRAGVARTVMVDGDPWAVPVTIDRANALFVRPTVLDAAGVALNEMTTVDAFIDALAQIERGTDAAGLVIPETGPWLLRLLSSIVLARFGTAGYEAFAHGEISVTRIREAVELLAQVVDGPQRLAPDLESTIARFRSADAGCILADRRLAGPLAGTEGWTIVAVPGTAGSFVMDVTGWVFPKRANRAVATAAVLEQLVTPSCQADIAAATQTLPARSTAPSHPESRYVDRLRAALADRERIVYAIDSGCGFDPDARRDSIAALDVRDLFGGDLRDVGDELIAALP